MRSLQLLCTVGGDLASPRTERNNIFPERGGVKLVVHITVSAGQLNEQGPPQRQICQDHDFEAAELY
jgi:hypothetical protein